VGLDEGDRIRRLAWAGDPEAGPRVRMFTGVHVIEPEIGPRLPERGCVVRETYAPLVEEGAPVFGADDGGFFRDLGTPGRYLDANVELLTGRARLDDFEPPAGGVHVDPGARVGAGCRLGPGTSICAGASVSPGTSVERAVILPGATVERDFAGAIACPDGRIVEA